MVAAIGRDGRAHLIAFEPGLGSAGQHVLRCITKPETTVRLDG